MTTTQTTLDTPATYTPSDHEQALREMYTAARDEARTAFDAAQARVAEMQAKLTTAKEAQAQRLAALATARQEAQTAATATLTAGQAEASEDENRAAYTAWRIEQEAQRAGAALSGLEAESAAAWAEVQRLSAVWGNAEAQVTAHELMIAQSGLLADWQALETRLHELVARTRAHNAEVRAARAGAALCLPGRVLASSRRSAREANADGFILRPALDLTTGAHPDAHLMWRDIAGALDLGCIAE